MATGARDLDDTVMERQPEIGRAKFYNEAAADGHELKTARSNEPPFMVGSVTALYCCYRSGW